MSLLPRPVRSLGQQLTGRFAELPPRNAILRDSTWFDHFKWAYDAWNRGLLSDAVYVAYLRVLLAQVRWKMDAGLIRIMLETAVPAKTKGHAEALADARRKEQLFIERDG